MMNIINYQILKQIHTIKKFKSKILKLENYDYDGWLTEN